MMNLNSLGRHYNCRIFFYFLLLILLQACGNAPLSYPEGATKPEAALATFEVEEGFTIELLAAEPLIASPVDMEIDEYGRLYVVEMPGYPLDNNRTGKIKLLTDTDGDGKMDKSMVFADQLIFPNGIQRWRNGVIVTDAPNILYLEDTDGDGHADFRDTLLTGFSLSNPHVNVNNPVYGLDNWIYLSHFGAIGTRKYGTEFGDQGTEIYFPDQPAQPRLPKNAEARTVRFQPDHKKLEMTSSKSQFGQTFDQWGHHFLTHNQNHIYEEVIAARYLKRNPELLVSNATQSVSDHGDATEVFQITKNPDRQLFTPVGLTTSSSGITMSLGGLFPPPFDGNMAFVAESVSNLIHADIIKDIGSSFIAGRQHSNKEFLASTDAWSRPVNMYVGPDGALYVLDYYRRIIEHPEWMSDEAIAAGNLYDGYNMGRIYRITPTGTKAANWTKGLALGSATTEQLVDYLDDKNIWWRQNAQRLLVDRRDKTALPALVKMSENKDAPLGRLHALWTLEGMGELSSELIKKALHDTVAGVRENAVKLAELHLTTSPELGTALLLLQNDTDPKVRFQLLCTLGDINTAAAAAARQKLLFNNLSDEWMQIAALSASASQAGSLLKEVLNTFKNDVPAYALLTQRLAAMIGAGKEQEAISKLIQKAIAPGSKKEESWQAPVLKGLSEGLKRNKSAHSVLQTMQPLLVNSYFVHPAAEVRKATLQLLKLTATEGHTIETEIVKAVSIAGNKKLPEERREEAINFLALSDAAPYANILKGLIIPQEQPSVQIAAIKILAKLPGTNVSTYLLQQWDVLTPDIRDAALPVFMQDEERIRLLLDAVEKKQVAPASISWNRRVQLMSNEDEKLRNTARALLTKNDSEKTNLEYQKALELPGNKAKGKVVYTQNCAICHQVRGASGIAFGPDLGTIHNWLAKDIIVNVLDPNFSIAQGFDLWELQLNEGSTLQGMIRNETSAAITLHSAPGVERTINRQDIKSVKALNMSLMPGLEAQINPQQMADLIAFLRDSRSE